MSAQKNIRTFKRTQKRKRIRKKLYGTAKRPRLAIFRSANNIYAQLIDDTGQRTLGGVSTLSPDLASGVKKTKTKMEAATLVGKAIAEKAKSMKIKAVVFDRGGYRYHGRVKAIADAARENGLTF